MFSHINLHPSKVVNHLQAANRDLFVAGDDASVDEGLQCVKRTYQPSIIIRKRRHGYLSRVRTHSGRRVLQRRRHKGRRNISA